MHHLPSFVRLRFLLIGFVAVTGVLRAQMLTSLYDFATPSGANIQGIGQFGANFYIYRNTSVLQSLRYSPSGGLAFTELPGDPAALAQASENMVLLGDSGGFLQANGSVLYIGAQMLGTSPGGPNGNFFVYHPETATFTTVGLVEQLYNMGTSFAATSSGTVFVTRSGPSTLPIYAFASVESTAPFMSIGESGDFYTALTVGHDGVLYALDHDASVIRRFDSTDGSLEGEFSIVSPGGFTAMVLDPSGRLIVADGNGGGTIYDSTTGEVLGGLTSSVAEGYDATGSRTVMWLDDQGYLYMNDSATGLHVFAVPEPGTWMLCGGALAILAGAHFFRRRKA